MKAKLLFSILFLSTFLLNSQNLVAYYPFNGNANDVSGNLNHGTVNGATLTTDRFGNINSAYSFDGDNDYILCNTQVGPFGNDSRTVSFWAKTDVEPNSSTQQNSVLSYGQWPTGGGRFEVLLNPKCRGLGVDVSTNYITKEFDNSDNDWHFYTVVFDNTISNALSDLKFYGDGVLLTNTCNTNGNININTLDEQVLNIGRLFYSGQPRYFKGSIDEIKIYNKALTIDEINNEYLGLVAYYPFNGDADDESGNANNGTVYGATLTTDRFGNANSAYSFDGNSNYISITNSPNINIQTGESFTISFWLKHSAQNNAKYMFSKYKGSSGEQSYAIGTGSVGDSYSWYEFSPGGVENRGSIDLNDNEWHLITSVFKSGESITTYIDGELDIEHSITHAGSIINSRDVTIGCGSNLAQFYNGSIDDIKIYKKALTIDEIKNEANGLVAYYPFNGNANDESGNNLNGTVSGATLTTDRFGNSDSAYSFDGSNDIITINHNDILHVSNELSISVWVKSNSFKNAMILGKSNYTSNTNYLLRTKSNGYIQFEYKDFANSNSLPLTAGVWNHIAVISKSDYSKQLYINGVLATHTSATSPYGLVTNALTIGARPGDEFFYGSIDDIKIYKKALTTTEVLSLFTDTALKVEKFDTVTESNFYVNNKTLYFKNTQNLQEVKTVEVYNILGQKVFKTSKITNEVSFKNLPVGVFILKVTNFNSNCQTLRFLSN